MVYIYITFCLSCLELVFVCAPVIVWSNSYICLTNGQIYNVKVSKWPNQYSGSDGTAESDANRGKQWNSKTFELQLFPYLEVLEHHIPYNTQYSLCPHILSHQDIKSFELKWSQDHLNSPYNFFINFSLLRGKKNIIYQKKYKIVLLATVFIFKQIVSK